MFPTNALAAVTHPDPYPYYLALLDRPALHRDESLGLWIAARADAVTAVLAHPECRVRPSGEPVPRALVGTPAGDVYAQLVRMTDGEAHYRRKPAVSDALRSLDLATVAAESRRWAVDLPVDQLIWTVDFFDFAHGVGPHIVFQNIPEKKKKTKIGHL